MLRARGVEPGSAAAAAFAAIAATDGNHGLALAWAARRFGCAAPIFVGQAVDEAPRTRIRGRRADVEVMDGTYGDAVVAAGRAAGDPSLLLVTDTYSGDGLAVKRCMQAGYGVLGLE